MPSSVYKTRNNFRPSLIGQRQLTRPTLARFDDCAPRNHPRYDPAMGFSTASWPTSWPASWPTSWPASWVD